MIIELLFAAAEYGAPYPTPPAPPPAVVTVRTTGTGTDIPASESIIEPDIGYELDTMSGWTVYADGAVRCVNAAPCQAEAGNDPDRYTYNWATGVYYGTTVTAS